MFAELSFLLNEKQLLTVVDDYLYDAESADNSTSYDQIHRVPSRAFQTVTVQRGVRLNGPDGLAASCLVTFQGTTPLRQSNVTIHGDHLYMAAGVSLCAVQLPRLQMIWCVDLLTGAKNGVYFSPLHRCILAVSDFDVTRIDSNGGVEWAASVFEFLTPDVTLDDHNITVCDDQGIRHVLDIDSGAKALG